MHHTPDSSSGRTIASSRRTPRRRPGLRRPPDQGSSLLRDPDARARTADRATKLHLEDIQTQFAHALDPAIQAAAGAAAPGRTGTALDEFDVSVASDSCWMDYAIRRNGGGSL
jgi:hypothetical protein